MNEIIKPTPHVDGFDGFTNEVEGDERPAGGIVRGPRIKFTNMATWVRADNEERLPDFDLVVVDILRVTQKWNPDGGAPETRILAAGEKFPNVKELNENTPHEQWREGYGGQPQGPHENAYVLYLLEPERVDRFTYITSTVGGGMAVRDLIERVQWARKFRSGAYPVVRLRDTFMPTRYEGRQRPHFEIQRWLTLGEGVALAAPGTLALPSSETSAEPAKAVLDQFAAGAKPETKPAAKPTPKPESKPTQMKEVQPPSNKEAMGGDSIPF